MAETNEDNERLRRMEEDIRELKGDMKEVRATLGEIKGALPHFATKAEVEQAKHEATKGKYGLILSVVALISSFGLLLTRIFLSSFYRNFYINPFTRTAHGLHPVGRFISGKSTQRSRDRERRLSYSHT